MLKSIKIRWSTLSCIKVSKTNLIFWVFWSNLSLFTGYVTDNKIKNENTIWNKISSAWIDKNSDSV